MRRFTVRTAAASARTGSTVGRLSDALRSTLVDVARLSILSAVYATPAREPRAEAYPLPLRGDRATFVSLHTGNELRGCCGTIEPYRPLVLDVWKSAHAAASEDRRFAAVLPDELAELELEISVLTPLARIVADDETALLAQLRPGIDGLYLRRGSSRATFLPKVWADLSDREQFLRQLKRKAGLDERFWSSEIEWFRYGTESFGGPFDTETTCH
jgi:AmmeMemoRadiSam system protein A